MRRTCRCGSDTALTTTHSEYGVVERNLSPLARIWEGIRQDFERLDEKESAANRVYFSLGSPLSGNEGDRWLREYAGPEDDKNKTLRRLLYSLAGGLDENFRESFRRVAIMAGRALVSPELEPDAAVEAWLGHVYRDAREHNSEWLFGATEDGGLIRRVVKSSIAACLRMEQLFPVESEPAITLTRASKRVLLPKKRRRNKPATNVPGGSAVPAVQPAIAPTPAENTASVRTEGSATAPSAISKSAAPSLFVRSKKPQTKNAALIKAYQDEFHQKTGQKLKLIDIAKALKYNSTTEILRWQRGDSKRPVSIDFHSRITKLLTIDKPHLK